MCINLNIELMSSFPARFLSGNNGGPLAQQYNTLITALDKAERDSLLFLFYLCNAPGTWSYCLCELFFIITIETKTGALLARNSVRAQIKTGLQ